MEAQSQIFEIFLSVISNREANLQVEVTSKVKNLQCISHITNGIEQYKKGQINKFLSEFKMGNDKVYKIEAI